jgi:hypothetical protein
MKVIVPEEIGGGGLRLLPAGVARATLEKIIMGKSKTGNPKATFRYTITDEMDGVAEDELSTIGETVLETYSLQSQVTGERLPQGDFELEEFGEMLNDTLCGTEWDLLLEPQLPADGSSDKERTTVVKSSFVG